MKKFLPNLITLVNLFCGINALILWLNAQYEQAFTFIVIAAAADFLDGFVARLLNVSSEIGKQLDSLCDLVSFGVFPSIIVYTYLKEHQSLGEFLPYAAWPAFLIALGAAYRLAKFNIDTRQTTDFIGLNTPSSTIFILGLYFIESQQVFGLDPFIKHPLFLYSICVIIPILMNTEIHMFGLKIKSFTLKGNELQLILVVCSLISIILLGWAALSFIILFYLILSILFHNKRLVNS